RRVRPDGPCEAVDGDQPAPGTVDQVDVDVAQAVVEPAAGQPVGGVVVPLGDAAQRVLDAPAVGPTAIAHLDNLAPNRFPLMPPAILVVAQLVAAGAVAGGQQVPGRVIRECPRVRERAITVVPVFFGLAALVIVAVLDAPAQAVGATADMAGII